jgi:hypothetical protein
MLDCRASADNGFCFETTIDEAWFDDKPNAPRSAQVWGYGSVRLEEGPSTIQDSIPVILKLDAVKGIYFTILLEGHRYLAPGVYAVNPIVSAEDRQRYCTDFDGEFRIDNLGFSGGGKIVLFEGRLYGSCPDPSGEITADVRFRLESDSLLRNDDDDDCIVGDPTGYSWKSEIGAYGWGRPRRLTAPDLEITASYYPPNLDVSIRGEDGSASWGFSGTGADGLSEGEIYLATADYMDWQALDQSRISIPAVAECAENDSSFTILEMAANPQNSSVITKLAIDFDYKCDGALIKGKLRLDSDVE